ncbi:hypothetical protein ACIGW1_18465 [Streptomyces sp. NPDC053780]|uniref:hypothetical protein n=1 Tax=unclassified Streptomyces TaxID=2593676 RepID=UPI0034455936
MSAYERNRANVLEYVRETWEHPDEYSFRHGPSQADVAHALFDGDFRQALAALRELERLGQARRVLKLNLYHWIPAEAPRPPKRQKRSTNQERSRAVTQRILTYVTDEFNAGKAGERTHLPSTRDVARACIMSGGSGSAGSCRRALAHLTRLVAHGKLIQVRDEEANPRYNFNRVYWALPNSGLMAEDNDEPELNQGPLNRYGFTAERWAAMKPWQRNLIRDIERAETAPTSCS